MGAVRTLLNKPSETTVMYQNARVVRSLLGARGKPVLRKVLDLITTVANEAKWPLIRLEVTHVEDKEVEDWQYVLILLVFNCAFQIADAHLHKLCARLDSLAEGLSTQERDILRRKLFFDIAATV